MKFKLNTRCRDIKISPDIIIEKLSIEHRDLDNKKAERLNKKNETVLIKQVEKIIKNNISKPIDTRTLLKKSINSKEV